MTTPQTVLVTGANRGIGLAIAEKFASENFSVLLSGRDEGSVAREAKRLSALGHDVNALVMDVSDRKSIRNALNSIKAPVYVLINNAGVLPDGDLLSLDDADIDLSFAVNVVGPLTLARTLAPGMIERGFGRIVNVSSDWGAFDAGMGGPGVYGVSKAALNALTVRLAKDLPDAVKVNAMNPGWVRTRMGGQSASRSPETAAETAFWLGTLSDDGPNGRFFFDRTQIAW